MEGAASEQNMGNKMHIVILLGLFLITALFASGSIFLIKKRVNELPKTTTQNTPPIQQQTPKQQQPQNTIIIPHSLTPTPSVAPVRVVGAQRPGGNKTASPSAQ